MTAVRSIFRNKSFKHLKITPAISVEVDPVRRADSGAERSAIDAEGRNRRGSKNREAFKNKIKGQVRKENTKSVKGQIRYLVYCMENAIMNLCSPASHRLFCWIDHDRFKLSDISYKATMETAHVLQEHYPERLGIGILYNPPKVFEHFWKQIGIGMRHSSRHVSL
ncbi:uncharacterized protein LOC144704457 [Wolffia australiana]